MDNILYCNRNLKRNKYIHFFLLVAVIISTIIPSPSQSVKFIPLLLFYIPIIFQRDFYNNKRRNYLLFILIVCSLSFFAHGFLEMKDILIYFISYSFIEYFVLKKGFNIKYIYWFIVFVTIFFLFKNPNTVSYIPINNVINIYGEGTKHGTATLGNLLFIVSLYNLHYKKQLTRKYEFKWIILIIVSIYLVVFSSSRSVTLALLATILMYVSNIKTFRTKLIWIIFILFNLSTYLLENLSNYIYLFSDNTFLSEFIRIENFDTSVGVTSGRAWLWNVHINSFLENPIFGGGRKVIDFRGNDYIPWLNEIANAGSESAFTGMLACNGFIGILQILLPIYLFSKAVNKRNIIGCVIIFCCIYNTTTGVNMVNNYGYNIFYTILYFMSFKKNKIISYYYGEH